MMRGSAAAQALADRMLKGLTSIAGFPEAEATVLKDKVLYGTVLRVGADGEPIQRGPGTRSMIKIAAEDIAAKLQKSEPWNAGVTVLSALALYGSLEADDKITIRKWINVSGGTANWAMASVQTFNSLVPIGAVGRALAKYGNGIGVFGTVASVLSGGITFYEGYNSPQRNNEKMFLGGIQALGGAASIAGMAMAAPVVQVLATAVVVTSVLYVTARDTDWDALTDSGSKRVFLAQLKWIETQDVFIKARVALPELDTAFGAVMNAVKADKTTLICLSSVGETMTRLAQLGFSTSDIEIICPRPLSAGPFLLDPATKI
jgi:hypothetical protein